MLLLEAEERRVERRAVLLAVPDHHPERPVEDRRRGPADAAPEVAAVERGDWAHHLVQLHLSMGGA